MSAKDSGKRAHAPYAVDQLSRGGEAIRCEPSVHRQLIRHERIVKKGAPGEAMYFIASGEIEVQLGKGTIKLGPGEFFGEMALLTRKPRNADVVALSYCHLLVLHARDFRRLLRGNAEIKAQIEAIASERLAQNKAQDEG